MGHTGFGDHQIPEKLNKKYYFDKCGQVMI